MLDVLARDLVLGQDFSSEPGAGVDVGGGHRKPEVLRWLVAESG
jgi:hypothetical protein